MDIIKTTPLKLNTKVTKVLLLPLVPKGDSMKPSLRKTLSHQNFAMKFAPYMHALLETIIPEKIKMLHRFKMAAK